MTAKIHKIRTNQHSSVSRAAEEPIALASRFPVLADVEAGAICWKSFAAFETTMPADEFRDFLASYLIDVELHLEQIARSRARQDFVAVAREARCIAIQASAFGALRARAAALRLEKACSSGAFPITYRLISELSRTCEEAGAQLHHWLHSSSRHP